MPEIVATAERMDIAPHVKDGYIMMFIYMPGVFPEEFLEYIGQVVKPILRALADENEYVRETALKVGPRAGCVWWSWQMFHLSIFMTWTVGKK
jgi:hypothetical protein